MKGITRFLTKGLSGLKLPGPGTLLILLLPLVLMAGCNGSNESLGGGGGTTGPTVSSTVPAAGATDVAIDAHITATFSTTMDSATITTSTFTVSDGTTDIAGTVALSADGVTATFIPTSLLTTGTLYTATITTGAKDINGNALAADKIWTFTAGSTLSPTVVSTFPLNADIGVPGTTNITATFSVAMASATINQNSFTLTTGATSVQGTVTLSADGLIATFNPTVDLAAGTTYTARITTVARDVNGNPILANEVWSFTTL